MERNSSQKTPNAAAVRAAVTSLALAAISAGAAGDFPERFSAEYTLHARGIAIGTTQLSLTPLGEERYEYLSQSAATGLAALISNDRIVERSIWQFDRDRVRPLRYEYDRKGGRKERRAEVQFEWAQAEVVNVAKGRTWRMSIPDGTLDKLSYMLALMNDLQDGKRELIYPVADGGQLKTYRVEGLGHQQLDTALGTLDTLMVRRTREGSPRQTTYWCAPALDYLPVQVEHRERDGSIITLRISAATGFDGLEKSP